MAPVVEVALGLVKNKNNEPGDTGSPVIVIDVVVVVVVAVVVV